MNYYPPIYPQYSQPTPQPVSQSGNLISVPNENEARMYPVAPGNSVTFKDENKPYIYTKTMGFSQLDRPIFERFKLTKEELSTSPQNPQNEPKYALHDDLVGALNRIMDLEEALMALKSKSGDKEKGDDGID